MAKWKPRLAGFRSTIVFLSFFGIPDPNNETETDIAAQAPSSAGWERSTQSEQARGKWSRREREGPSRIILDSETGILDTPFDLSTLAIEEASR
jgi:hypothetical protein